MPLSVGEILQDRYRVDGFLKEGGMGAVYKAIPVNECVLSQMNGYSAPVQQKSVFSRAIFGKKDSKIVSELEFMAQFTSKYRYLDDE